MENTMSTKTKLPKWFDGEHYSKGEEVTNPFSGESYKLNRTELSMYDFIKGAEHIFGVHQATQPNTELNPQILKDFEKGLDWFRSANAKAYMVLLD